MGESDGGVLVRIDADTASYIAKLSRMAEGHEKVTKHAEGWGDAVEHVISGFTKALVPLMLIESTVEVIKDGIEAWNKQIERAGQTADVLVSKLRRTTAQTGENREVVASQLLNEQSTLSVAQRQAAYAAYRQAAPGSATSVSAGEVVRRAGQAEIAGYDPEQVSRLAGNLHGVFSGKSFDAAALLLNKTGDNADSAAEMIRRLSNKAGPETAQQLAPYLIASAQAGDKRFSILNGLVGGYNPAFGSISDYISNSKFRVSADQRNAYEGMMRRVPGAQGDIANLDGYIERRAQGALGDESVSTSMETKYFNSAAEVAEYEKEGARAERRERKAARQRLNAVSDPIDASAIPNIHEAIQRLTGQFKNYDFAEEAVRGAAGFKNSPEEMAEARRLIEERNEEHLKEIRRATTERRMREDVHGESK